MRRIAHSIKTNSVLAQAQKFFSQYFVCRHLDESSRYHCTQMLGTEWKAPIIRQFLLTKYRFAAARRTHGGIADEAPRICESHTTGRASVALVVGNDLNLAVTEHSDGRVRGAQVNTNGGSFGGHFCWKMEMAPCEI